ncbi:MAG: DoxX family protein [Halieaceae bacterium]
MTMFQNSCLLAGRFLLGLYFILPGISKVTNFAGTSEYMAQHAVPMIPVLLVLTIILQLGAGAAIIVGFQGRLAAFLLAGLTLVISIAMHHFWDLEDGVARAHETQNFFKNMGIMAGLLVVAGLGTGAFSLDSRSAGTPSPGSDSG